MQKYRKIILSRYLYKSKDRPRLLGKVSKAARDEIIKLIEDGSFEMEEVSCPCGKSAGEVLATRDSFGLPLGTILCESCGLIRSSPRLTADSYGEFYGNHLFKRLYLQKCDEKTSYEDFEKSYFEGSVARGHEILEIVKPYLASLGRKSNCEIKILEIGCGPAGILVPFIREGYECLGLDIDDRFVNPARESGIEIRVGRLSDFSDLQNLDLIITNHYLEHVSDLNAEIIGYKNALKANTGLVFVGVPGLRSLDFGMQNDFLMLIQFAHTYIYDLFTLDALFNKFGFKRRFGNHVIDAIYQNCHERIKDTNSKLIQIYIEELRTFLKLIEKKRYAKSLYYAIQKYLHFYIGTDNIIWGKEIYRNIRRKFCRQLK